MARRAAEETCRELEAGSKCDKKQECKSREDTHYHCDSEGKPEKGDTHEHCAYEEKENKEKEKKQWDLIWGEGIYDDVMPVIKSCEEISSKGKCEKAELSADEKAKLK